MSLIRIVAFIVALFGIAPSAHAQIVSSPPPTPPGIPIAFATSVRINSTGDVAVIPITVPNVSYIVVTGVIITNASATPDSGDVGGVYTAASGGGTELAAIGSNLAGLTSPTLAKLWLRGATGGLATTEPVLTNNSDNIYLNFSNADPNPITVDIYIFGVAIPYF